MKTNTNLETSVGGEKEIKTKLQSKTTSRTSLVVFCVTVLMVLSISLGLQYADAAQEEERLELKVLPVTAAIDDLFKDPYSVIKEYKSGGFSVRNPAMAMLLFAHPIDQTNLFVFTVIEYIEGEPKQVTRFLVEGDTFNNTKEEPTTAPEPSPQRIEPKSSIGADITRYDVPNVNPKDRTIPDRLIVYANVPSLVNTTNEFTAYIEVVNHVGSLKPVADAKVTLEISRDNHIITSLDGLTSKAGTWSPVLNLGFPTLYPGHCYDVTVTAYHNNQTAVETEDFLVYTTAKYWENAGDDVISRDTILSDAKCNR